MGVVQPTQVEQGFLEQEILHPIVKTHPNPPLIVGWESVGWPPGRGGVGRAMKDHFNPPV